MKKLNILIKITSIIAAITIIYIMFFSSKNILFTVGAIGGCAFLLQLILEGSFPKWFEDSKTKK